MTRATVWVWDFLCSSEDPFSFQGSLVSRSLQLKHCGRYLLLSLSVNFGMLQDQERTYIETAQIGRLATVDTEGRPHVVPICFTLVDGHVVTAIDEKPKNTSPDTLRRSQNISENPHVALIVDHYTDDWSQLGWVQVRGKATYCTPSDEPHSSAVTALRQKYDQYTNHNLENCPLIRISLNSVRSWGCLERPDKSHYLP